MYKLIHVRNCTCLKPYVLQIIRVWNHTRYKSYTVQIIRVWNHTRYKSYTVQIIRVWNHARYKSYAYEMTAFYWTISDTPLSYAPVLLAGDAMALVRRTKKITDTQQDRRDCLVEHLRRYYFACAAYNCISMTHGWRTCDAYGVWMAMPLRMMSCMRTWPLRIHGAGGVCTTNIPRMRGGQRDSIAHGGHMYSAWAAYMLNL